MTQMISLEKSGRTAGKPHRALSEGDGHRWPTIPPNRQHGGRTSSVGGPMAVAIAPLNIAPFVLAGGY
jgi:hypothetical protein